MYAWGMSIDFLTDALNMKEHCIHAVLTESRQGTGCTGSGVVEGCGLWSNPGPLKEQCVLSVTERSLQP